MRQSGVSLTSLGQGRGNAQKGRVPLLRGPADWLRGAEALPPGRHEGGASGPGTGVAYRLQPDDHGSSDQSEGSGQGGVGVPSEVDHRGGNPGAGTCAQRQVASGGFPGGLPARGGAVAEVLIVGSARGSSGARRRPACVHLVFSG